VKVKSMSMNAVMNARQEAEEGQDGECGHGVQQRRVEDGQ
jgi:hypothetical protein